MAEITKNVRDAVLPAGIEGEPEWVASLRRRAAEAVETVGFPSARDEDWKYNPVAKTLARDFAPGADHAADWEGELPSIEGAAARLVFVDGRFFPERSRVGDLAKGVRVGSLLAALRGAEDGVPDWLGRVAEFETRGLAALNTAIPADGALVTFDEGSVLAGPVHLVFVTTAAADGRMIPIRNLVVAGPAASGRIVEHHIGPGADAVTNLVTEFVVESGANLDLVKLVEGNEGVTHLASLDARIEGQANFAARMLSTGGASCRTETRALLTGRGADCHLAMATLGRGGQIMDQLTRVEHAAPDATSRQIHRSVVDGKARSIFNGLVVVNPGSHGTSGEQSSRNLVLSPDADAHARPQLDISEDDVKCAHGATVGALDPDAVFYLRSRGVGEADAKRLLVRAFATEALEGLEGGPVRDEAERILSDWV
jgi:Fe-S cluster assembly protein SufD